MVAVLPDDGRFEEVDSSLDAARLASIIGGLRFADVTLRMPRFKIDPAGSVSLKSPLIDLGMTDAFDLLRADFTGIGCCPSLYITEVLHKAFIAVDEAGTEAAAATAVILGPTSVPEPVEMTIDRPFIFLIRDRPSGAVLFFGRLVDPSN